MKVRQGFVSNSSVSSFLVQVKDCFSASKKRGLTRKQLEVLYKRGFSVDEYDAKLTVVCNQDYEISALLRHKIPFTANLHYGTESFIYDGEKAFLIQNPGMHAEIYGINSFKESYPELLVRPIDTKKWLVSKKEEKDSENKSSLCE